MHNCKILIVANSEPAIEAGRQALIEDGYGNIETVHRGCDVALAEGGGQITDFVYNSAILLGCTSDH